METIVKSFEVKAVDAKTQGNTIAGAASVLGVMDRSWAKDVMCPGCFDGALEGFRRNGFVPSGHDWGDYAKLVAMPTLAEQRGNQLYCEARFHSTDYAQEVKRICEERLSAGLSIGLSVGFTIAEDGAQWFNSGADLMAWAKGKGFDLSQFDPSIASYQEECRAVHKVAELFEYSIVTVPANPKAVATAIKSQPYRKSLDNSVSAILQAKIHQSFTVAADELAVRGYMDTPERIELSGAISACLKLFAETLDPSVGTRIVKAEDVDWVASKQLSSGVVTLESDLDSALGAVKQVIDRLCALKAMRESEGKRVSAERLAQAEELSDQLRDLVSTATPQGAHDRTSKFKNLSFRTLGARTSGL